MLSHETQDTGVVASGTRLTSHTVGAACSTEGNHCRRPESHSRNTIRIAMKFTTSLGGSVRTDAVRLSLHCGLEWETPTDHRVHFGQLDPARRHLRL